ncbi:inositol monophosphatase family protein [Brachybacterium phenoliresistens]|uniref:Inositol monophosphatase n=1 Tax=Brachybacterium phenoliresistens TaxID=396014 RepID=Z9JTP1_9MICO|nr:inositol monophosphatase family protein [Brachybacterium phenoliresistens]EWS81122.1 inositol monophosphatase [Brachybacterium phenoliresistens]
MDLRSAADLAISLARRAGDLAVAERETARVRSKGDGADLVTHVDHAAERLIAAGIAERYPEHGILGEEEGEQGAGADAPLRWLIDPLDGTNNYVLGLDVYGVCITLCDREGPLVAVVHDSPRRRTCWAIRGEGAYLSVGASGPRRLRLDAADPLAHTTVSFTQGYAVGHDDARRNAIFGALERSAKRVLRTWAPSADWVLLATGRLGALLAYRNEIWDLLGGILIAEEAGADVLRDRTGELVLVGHPGTVQELRGLVGPDGLIGLDG